MPPKKQQQENTAPYVPIYVLPLIINSSHALQTLRKSVSIKKDIDKNKIIQLLKEKGLDKFLKEGNIISEDGQKFICQNMPLVYQEFINQIKKPADPKKEVKKDTKKDAKKEQVQQQQKQKPIQFDFPKQCTDFYFLYDYPATMQQLQICLKSKTKIDIILLIEQKVKKGSKPPNYALLNFSRPAQQLSNQLQATLIRSKNDNQKSSETEITNVNQIVQHFKKKQSQYNHIQSSIIVQLNYLNDLTHPENNQSNFLKSVFKKLCELTIDKQAYANWKSNIKLMPMVQPIAQIVKKQVQVQDKKQDKKGAKKQNKQPQFQTVQQTVYTPYQNVKQNIKSDLKQYERLCKLNLPINNKKKDQITFALQNCILTISNQTKNQSQNQADLIFDRLNGLHNIPIGKNSVQNLKDKVRDICYYKPEYLNFQIQTPSTPLDNSIRFSQILQIAPEKQQTLRMQSMLQQFKNFMASQQPKINWDFSDRLYMEKLSRNTILSEINQQLLKDPRTYKGELINDKIKLFVLARINPPGRVLYNNNSFDWKVAPNFQKWQHQFKNNKSLMQKQQFYNYKFQDAGSLAIKSQRMMPNDNTIITDSTYAIGNTKFRINNFDKEDKTFGIKKVNQTNQFWFNYKNSINLSVFQKDHKFIRTGITQEVNERGQKVIVQIQTQQNLKRVQTWLRNSKYLLANDPYPKIYWKNHIVELCRQFGPKGEVTIHFKDGSKKIYFPNGDVSKLRNCRWTKYKQNICTENGHQRQSSFEVYSQGSKQIKIRQDNTVFVHYENEDTQIIFDDSTQIYNNLQQRKIEILTKHCQQDIVVRLTQPRDKDFNVIGFGSAFAYLGFQNLIQRSYDGFIYQIWTPSLSSHLYIQKYELNTQLYEEEVRLLRFQDGTIIKVLGNGTMNYIAGNYDKNRTKLNQNWHQLFTNPQNHKQGVYDVDLNIGSIWTKDAQSNFFQINVLQDCHANVAVSFKIGDDEKIQNNFGNGFHVPQQNYFLPPPTNRVAPRLFSFDEEGNYYQYLTKQQLRCMRPQQYNIEEQKRGEILIRQYTKPETNKNMFSDITFSKCIDFDKFQIPALVLPKNSRINMPIQNDSRILHRIIQQVPWNSTFANIKALQNQILELKKKRQNQLAVFVK